MERIEKIKLAIQRGFTCDLEKGIVYGIKGNVITKKSYGYITCSISINKKDYYFSAHQFVWFIAYGYCVDCIDHINGNRSDNRISNLRSVTQQKNTFNRICKGYYKVGNKWVANIKHNYKTIYLGTYKTEDDAHKAYLEAKQKYHII